jgi:hypothetical protein
MRVFGIGLKVLIFGVLFDLSSLASFDSFFFELIRFTCHCSFIALDAGSLEDDSVNRDVHSCLDF